MSKLEILSKFTGSPERIQAQSASVNKDGHYVFKFATEAERLHGYSAIKSIGYEKADIEKFQESGIHRFGLRINPWN